MDAFVALMGLWVWIGMPDIVEGGAVEAVRGRTSPERKVLLHCGGFEVSEYCYSAAGYL